MFSFRQKCLDADTVKAFFKTSLCWECCQKILYKITNVLSVSAYNTITTKPIATKTFCWKNKCHFLRNKFRMKCVIMTQMRWPKIYKNLHLKGGVNKWKWGKWVAIFPKNWYCPIPSCNKVTQSTSLKNCLSIFNFFTVSFFLLPLCISKENRTKAEENT